jgi:hypothetical protein
VGRKWGSACLSRKKKQMKKVYPRFGKLLDARKLDRQTFSAYDGRFPVLLSNVFVCGHETLLQNITEFLKGRRIHYETRIDRAKADDLPHSEDQFLTFDIFSSLLKKSKHERSHLMHDETVLQRCTFQDNFQLPYELFGVNYFDYFPSSMQSGHALYIGGKGFRSRLHCDPYMWTGSNIYEADSVLLF